MSKPIWQVLRFNARYEKSIVDELWEGIVTAGAEKYFFGKENIKMITEPVVNKKTKKISLKNKYPGNIFIKMIPDSVANFVILSVLKSRGGGQFLGTFLESELNRRLFKFSDNSSIKGSKLKVNFKPDDYVRLILPNFKDKLGKVIRINPYENKVVVAIDLEPTIINVVVRIEDCKRLEE